MSSNYLLYDPADFGAVEIKEDTRDAEIIRLREEIARLREAVQKAEEWFEAVAKDGSWDGWEYSYKEMRWKILPAARAAIREGGKE